MTLKFFNETAKAMLFTALVIFFTGILKAQPLVVSEADKLIRHLQKERSGYAEKQEQVNTEIKTFTTTVLEPHNKDAAEQKKQLDNVVKAGYDATSQASVDAYNRRIAELNTWGAKVDSSKKRIETQWAGLNKRKTENTAKIVELENNIKDQVRKYKPACTDKGDNMEAIINCWKTYVAGLGKKSSGNIAAIKEQKKLTENFDVWISDQHARVKNAVIADSNWTKACLATLKGFSPPETSFRPKGLNDLKNGDVLLLFPKTTKDRLIDWADKFYNSYSQQEDQKACHGLVFIGRDAAGKSLFLNNTARSFLHPEDGQGGPHIIGETEFEQLYGQSDYYVARPRTVVDGKKLLQTAKEMHLKASNEISLAGSSYGVLGDNLVCTESSDIAVARATGRQLIDKKKFIDVSPNNFFDKNDAGRYYIISPLVNQK